MEPRPHPSGLDEPAADRVARELHPVAHAELLEAVRSLAPDRLLVYDELLGDLRVGVRLGDELDDLLLARREGVRARRLAAARALEVVAHDRAHRARVEDRLAAHRGAARGD